MNVGGSGDRCHEFFEWCRSEGVRVVLKGESAAYRSGGITTMAGYNIVSRWGKVQRVVAYLAAEWKNKMELAYQEGRMVVLQLWERIFVGIYGDLKAGRMKYRKWLKEVRKHVGRSKGVIMGDWNIHHRLWVERVDTLVQDSRGEEFRE